jgi:hypothetical protein
MALKLRGNQAGNVALGCSKRDGAQGILGRGLLKTARKSVDVAAGRPALAQCGDTTPLQENTTTATRAGTWRRLSAIAGITVDMRNSDEHRAPGVVCSIRRGLWFSTPKLIAEGNIV